MGVAICQLYICLFDFFFLHHHNHQPLLILSIIWIRFYVRAIWPLVLTNSTFFNALLAKNYITKSCGTDKCFVLSILDWDYMFHLFLSHMRKINNSVRLFISFEKTIAHHWLYRNQKTSLRLVLDHPGKEKNLRIQKVRRF